jgi:serine/threonine protein kinase
MAFSKHTMGRGGTHTHTHTHARARACARAREQGRAYQHTLGKVHRDIKCGNILLTATGVWLCVPYRRVTRRRDTTHTHTRTCTRKACVRVCACNMAVLCKLAAACGRSGEMQPATRYVHTHARVRAHTQVA